MAKVRTFGGTVPFLPVPPFPTVASRPPERIFLGDANTLQRRPVVCPVGGDIGCFPPFPELVLLWSLIFLFLDTAQHFLLSPSSTCSPLGRPAATLVALWVCPNVCYAPGPRPFSKGTRGRATTKIFFFSPVLFFFFRYPALEFFADFLDFYVTISVWWLWRSSPTFSSSPWVGGSLSLVSFCPVNVIPPCRFLTPHVTVPPYVFAPAAVNYHRLLPSEVPISTFLFSFSDAGPFPRAVRRD